MKNGIFVRVHQGDVSETQYEQVRRFGTALSADRRAGVEFKRFRIEFLVEGAEIARFLRFLDSIGLVKSSDDWIHSGYSVDVWNIFEQADVDGAQYFDPGPTSMFSMVTPEMTTDVGVDEIVIDTSEIVSTAVLDEEKRAVSGLLSGALPIAYADMRKIIVSDSLRSALLEEKFKRIRLTTRVEFAGKLRKRARGCYWLLDSDLTLPRRVPRPDQFEWPKTGDEQMDARVRGYRLDIQEVAYTKSILEGVGEWDVAIPFEPKEDSALSQALVVSRRFYEFCMRLDLPMRWTPEEVLPI